VLYGSTITALPLQKHSLFSWSAQLNQIVHQMKER